MKTYHYTDHYFLLAAKEDFFRFEKQYLCVKKYLRLLHGKNKLFKISERNRPPPPSGSILCICGPSATQLDPAV